ncbi:MAG TPA: glucoamylase family protein [Acidobacteriaceae bacterium]|nr:glucoamylase family protein [Acidobacteriaceae bacterium]
MPYQIPEIDQEFFDQAGIRVESLTEHALAQPAQWSTNHRPVGPLPILDSLEQVRTAFHTLTDELQQLKPDSAASLRDLRENPRLLHSAILEMAAIRRKISRLPRINNEPRNAVLARAYFDAAHSLWNGSAFRIYVNAIQQKDPLDLNELWALPAFLKYELLQLILAQANALLHASQTTQFEAPTLLAARIQSLRDIGHVDWTLLMEPLILFDAALKQDPTGAYPRMDFDSRENYRKRIAQIARRSECSESQVAAIALQLAEDAHQKHVDDPRLHARHAHIGYYLIDSGLPSLLTSVGYHPTFLDRLRTLVRRNADDFYIGGIEILSVLLIAAILAPLVPNYSIIGGLTYAFIILLLPATQAAVDFISNTTTSLFQATTLPKLDFSKGIPAEYSTLVAVPTLLISDKQVRELVSELEVRFLANPDPNLHFALLTDLPDSVTRPREDDNDPLVDLAVELINDLNRRYPASSKHGSFFFLHRFRVFNARQGVWMGWERKRGKLLDLNKFLSAAYDAFPVKVGHMPTLAQVKYIITLDSDTQLPPGTAAAMAGAMAHPLNRAIIDPVRRIVTAGYGILQPRVGVSVHSATRSRLAALYSGQTGIDIYTRAISDAYQDLYGEGSFTGKGIYEVSTLHAVFDKRFPRNSLLSHDLIEGAYARAGLLTDIEVIDDYPSHYSAHTRRQHRWVRGDWQIAQWLFSRVPDESGHRVRNPISTISRWKIFDNLRRSLVEPFTFILLISGWLGLPGGALYWTLVTLFLLVAPTLVHFVFRLGHALTSQQQGSISGVMNGLSQAMFRVLLNIAFLPHQTMFSLDAIIRSLIRRFVTGERLLEWETAAQAEASRGRRTSVDSYLAATSIFAAALAILVAATELRSLLIAAPFLILWGFASGISLWLNHPPSELKHILRPSGKTFLLHHALRIWRFFYEYGGERHNHLIPDNVEEGDLFEAARVSPTNFGLLLNARQAAVRLGFLTLPEFTALTRQSFATMDRLPKYRGHLYNWYNTHTLEPLPPITISSVDSGNLCASLYTLRTGADSFLGMSLLSRQLFMGLRSHWELLHQHKDIPTTIASHPLPASNAGLQQWCDWTLAAASLPDFTGVPEILQPCPSESAWWLHETGARIRAINGLITSYAPWLLPEFEPLRQIPALGLHADDLFTPLKDAAAFANQLENRLARTWATLNITEDESSNSLLVEKLRAELPAVSTRLRALEAEVQAISAEAFQKAVEMDFSFLVLESRQLLSIGYEVETGKLHDACYDMLASEARIATFLAVSRGELPHSSWFKMARTHTSAFGRFVLLSWSGTMFEYLMPTIWMRSYPGTLIERSLASTVEIQRRFVRAIGIPWGISEAGHAQTDDAGHYQYQAFGIPQISLKWDATAGPVISPYSTFLALGVNVKEALRNLHRMENAGWTGAYGFYESADYTASRKKPVLVKEWMAHHQGMALLAILNLLDNNIVQEWFHANREFQANELLLHERSIHPTILKAELRRNTI